MGARALAVALALLAGQLASTPPPGESAAPSFEVSTVKKNTSIDRSTMSVGIQPGGRFVAVAANVRFMIAIAYRTNRRLFQSEIIGGPDWLTSDRYDITAKLGEDFAGKTAQQSFQSIGPLVRALLEDRFKLRVHHEMRAMPSYALLVAKQGSLGPQMKASAVDCAVDPSQCRFQSLPGHFAGKAVQMNDLLIALGSAVERAIVNQTGLSGRYDVELEWSPDQLATDKPSVFTALQEQLGLKLESNRSPVDVVVIDNVERPAED